MRFILTTLIIRIVNINQLIIVTHVVKTPTYNGQPLKQVHKVNPSIGNIKVSNNNVVSNHQNRFIKKLSQTHKQTVSHNYPNRHVKKSPQISYYLKSFPKGIKPSRISLKCWIPKGIPISVTHNNKPNTKCVNAIHIPPINIQIILSSNDIVADDSCISTILFPKGTKLAIPTLKHCKPKGIPIIVMHSISPANIYSKNIKKPPNMIQSKLPSTLMIN